MFALRSRFHHYLVLVASLLLSVTCGAQDRTAKPASPGSVVAKLSKEVEATKLVVSDPWVADWLTTATKLPQIVPRTVTFDSKELVVDEEMYYLGRYGSPLAYARALDLAAKAGFSGNTSARIFDFGYGNIGHLTMLAMSGHHCVGVDVAPLLKVLYADSSGRIGNGSVEVLDGRFPKEQELVKKVGTGYDLVLSKNVLKLGYIHPTRPVSDARKLIDLGVDDARFIESIASMLKPSGLFVIYNFCPAKAKDDQPYIPWAEGESPFSKEAFTNGGFDVLQFDVNDTLEARRVGRALKWDIDGGMKLDTDLFAWYTIVRKKTESESTKP